MHTSCVHPGWYRCCIAHAECQGLSVEGTLRAFGSSPPVEEEKCDSSSDDRGQPLGVEGDPEFSRLVSWASKHVEATERAVAAGLNDVDEAQARLFARRFRAVFGILAQSNALEAEIYRVALLCRVLEVISGPDPRALRVRALCDFYYSQAALLHHKSASLGQPVATLEERLRDARWDDIAPGIAHAHVKGLTDLGPVNLNLLRQREGHIQTLDCRGENLVDLVRSRGAIAAVSGGFFLYSEPKIETPSARGDPVGLLVGHRFRPPVFCRSAIVERRGRWSVETIGLNAVSVRLGENWVRIDATNEVGALGLKAVAFNRAWGRDVPWRNCIAIVGDRVVGGTEIPLAGFVLALPSDRDCRMLLKGDLRVHYRMHDPMDAGMAGGPALLGAGALNLRREDFAKTAPPVTFSQDETFDQNLLPRMAAGVDLHGTLFFCAVDGRNFHRAPGLTLGMTARCMAALGCVQAMNLDGGSSKRMVVGERAVDLSSTEVHSGSAPIEPVEHEIRPVRSCILMYSEARR